MSAHRIPFRQTHFPSAEMRLERREDGTLVVRPVLQLAAYEPNLPAVLARRAELHPDKPYLAERRPAGGDWYRHSYAETWRDTRAVAQWLLDRRIGPGGRGRGRGGG